jgi:CRP-like cAMP-binding protein
MAISDVTVRRVAEPPPAGPLQQGMRTDPSGKAIRNVLLLSISDAEYDLIRPQLELIELPHHFVMHDPGEKLEFAYFLNEGMASLVVVTKDGRSVEVGVVGREGLVGTSLAVGLNRGPYRAIMQISGSGLRVPADVLHNLLSTVLELRLKLNRYVLVQGLQVAQVAACNRLHGLEQRLARWLLMCQDRVDSDQLSLTHDFLAQMLGTGRPSVTLAAGELEQAGVIENRRGAIKVINRKGMEQAACECYDVIQHFNGGLGLK